MHLLTNVSAECLAVTVCLAVQAFNLNFKFKLHSKFHGEPDADSMTSRI